MWVGQRPLVCWVGVGQSASPGLLGWYGSVSVPWWYGSVSVPWSAWFVSQRPLVGWVGTCGSVSIPSLHINWCVCVSGVVSMGGAPSVLFVNV